MLTIRIEIAPETLYKQLNTGENYTFQLSITNNNLTLRSGDPILAPEIFLSGNLMVKIKFVLSKEGVIRYGANKMIYGSQLQESERSTIVQLPEIGGQVELSFVYPCNQTYDVNNAALDEWLRLSLNVKVYGEVYSIENGSLENRTYFAGPELYDIETDYYYIISNEKIQYISGKFSEIEESVESFLKYKIDVENKTGESLDLDFKSILDDYSKIKNLFEKGDYVSTSKEIENWWHRPEKVLLDYLVLKLVQFSEYKSLAAEIEDIKLDYLDEIYYKELEIKQLRGAENLYLYAIIGLVILSIALFVFRFKRGRREESDIIERAKILIGKNRF